MRKSVVGVLSALVVALGTVAVSGTAAQAAEVDSATPVTASAATVPVKAGLVYSPRAVAGSPIAAAAYVLPAGAKGTIKIRLRGPGYQKFGAGHLFHAKAPAAGDYTFFVHFVPAEGSPYAETTVAYPLHVLPAPGA